jgi:putative ABC transport system permease protein
MSLFLLGVFNAEAGAFAFIPSAVIAQVAISLLTPLVVSLVPVFSGARITVREAISTYGLSAQTDRLGRWLAKTQQLSRMLLLILNNTFRNKGRVILTQLTLVGSGLIFIMVMGVNDSVRYTFGDLLFSILNFNVSLSFEDQERIAEVESLTLAHPDVKAVEMWGFGGGTIHRNDRPKSNDDEEVVLFGIPLPTTLYGPQLRAGRWLEPADTYAVVLNQQLAEDAGVTVGDWVILDQNLYGESSWQVVGLLFDPIITNSAHVPRATLLRETRSVGKASTVWIQTKRDDPAGEIVAASALRKYYEAHELKVNPQSPFGRDTASEITQQILNNFGVIVTLLVVMSIVMGLVGGIALSGVLSLSVLERRREIGVMRAIGASSWAIFRLFAGEGLMLGWLSWLIAAPLSIPAGYLMAQGLGAALQGEIVYNFTPTGALYWLAIVTVLSIAASWLPARSATQVSVRESLAYQ